MPFMTNPIILYYQDDRTISIFSINMALGLTHRFGYYWALLVVYFESITNSFLWIQRTLAMHLLHFSRLQS